MSAFIKSDLVRNFLGGFLLGTMLVIALDGNRAQASAEPAQPIQSVEQAGP